MYRLTCRFLTLADIARQCGCKICIKLEITQSVAWAGYSFGNADVWHANCVNTWNLINGRGVWNNQLYIALTVLFSSCSVRPWYSNLKLEWKCLAGKVSRSPSIPRKPRNFSTSNNLQYTVLIHDDDLALWGSCFINCETFCYSIPHFQSMFHSID